MYVRWTNRGHVSKTPPFLREYSADGTEVVAGFTLLFLENLLLNLFKIQ